ncbi:MAG: PPC domain-containing DNA-binding protein [Limnochordia bacterium]|jgi:predicted DNA-binding protein with PD1-like motif
MEVIKGTVSSELIAITLAPNELLLESLQEVIDREDIQGGVVVSGIGSLRVCNVHEVDAGHPINLMTRKQRYYTYEGSIEVSAIQGIIAGGEPHLHLTGCLNGDKIVTGHIEKGCVVLTVIELAILKLGHFPARRDYKQPERIRTITTDQEGQK